MTPQQIKATERRLNNAWKFILGHKLPLGITDAIAEIVECELLLEAESNK